MFGIVYGVLLVGVPSPDATAEMARVEAFHSSVSGAFVLTGVCLLLLGIVASVASGTVWLGRKLLSLAQDS